MIGHLTIGARKFGENISLAGEGKRIDSAAFVLELERTVWMVVFESRWAWTVARDPLILP